MFAGKKLQIVLGTLAVCAAVGAMVVVVMRQRPYSDREGSQPEGLGDPVVASSPGASPDTGLDIPGVIAPFDGPSSGASKPNGTAGAGPGDVKSESLEFLVNNLKIAAVTSDRDGIQRYVMKVKQQGDPAVPYLVGMSRDKEKRVRNMGIYMLGIMKRRDQEDHIRGFLVDSDEDVRTCAINALTAVSSTKSIPEIQAMASQDASGQVRDAAAKAIKKLGVR